MAALTILTKLSAVDVAMTVDTLAAGLGEQQGLVAGDALSLTVGVLQKKSRGVNEFRADLCGSPAFVPVAEGTFTFIFAVRIIDFSLSGGNGPCQDPHRHHDQPLVFPVHLSTSFDRIIFFR
jgi:hypothetical protein